MTVTWETARSADGPAIAAWLHERGVGTSTIVDRWERGERADFFALDGLLIQLGLHPIDVPAELWRAEPGVGKLRPTGRPPRSVCKRGHPLSGPNLYVDPAGERRCRACKRRHKRSAGVPEAKELGALTDRQKTALVEVIGR